MGTKKPPYKCEEYHVEGKVTAIENIKSAILGHFSLQEISNAKDILWEKCDVTIIGDKLKRRDFSVRSEKEANVHDLMVALTKLDNSDILPTFAVTATELYKIPKFNPEEIVSTSIVDRLVSLENKFSIIQNTVDRCVCKNLEMKDILDAKTSYVSVLTSSDIVPSIEPPRMSQTDKIKNRSFASSGTAHAQNTKNEASTNKQLKTWG